MAYSALSIINIIKIEYKIYSLFTKSRYPIIITRVSGIKDISNMIYDAVRSDFQGFRIALHIAYFFVQFM
ncbi:hypothetical protein J21TS3_31740 [Paenibacillus cookii]|uniref:Uncharacterized protein n=1 Tax=Paenibacillus cookii TaxID=157839 RepID=A0ABQ4LYY7_9BACL|nr:hypothetical protein J21TS3_31740 [Paenibacillus cookii]